MAPVSVHLRTVRNRLRPGSSTGGEVNRAAGEPAPVERWSTCYAPHSSMYLDQFGKVRACCQNTEAYLGDVTEQSLRTIWESAEADHLRTTLEADDYSAGCSFCEWQHREGNDAVVFARQFDKLRPEERRPRWPRQMEFSLTNTCNLACVMCNGDWSSTIRAKREQRDPIPPAYDDAFFDQLREFLPHLEQADFLGGEPFLGKEPLRVMEMLAELPDPPHVSITTNGTIFTRRVQRIIEALNPDVVISLDGSDVETYDAIRVGAHFPEVLANIDRFRAQLGPGKVSITHCLMTSNWHGFAELLRIAEEREMYVGVNVVRFPAEASLYQLPADELRPVVETMAATDASFLTGRRLEMWNGHCAALANRLETIEAADPSLGPAFGLAGAPQGPDGGDPDAEYQGPPGTPSEDVPWPWVPFAPHVPDAVAVEPPATPGAAHAVLEIGIDGVIHLRHASGTLPVRVDDLDGAGVEVLEARFAAACGPGSEWDIEPDPTNPDRLDIDAAGVLAITICAQRDRLGNLQGGRYLIRSAG